MGRARLELIYALRGECYCARAVRGCSFRSRVASRVALAGVILGTALFASSVVDARDRDRMASSSALPDVSPLQNRTDTRGWGAGVLDKEREAWGSGTVPT